MKASRCTTLASAMFAATLAVCLVSLSQGATLNLQNDCTDQITVYTEQGTQQTPTTYILAAGAGQAVDVGASWPAGVVWAGNPNRALASLAEFTILDGGPSTYDISLVNAYNLGIEINPTTPSGSTCDDIKCTIAGLQGFCGQGTDNVYTPASDGNSEACTNTDGPQPPSNAECCCSTSNTQKFKGACPDAYSFSKDDGSSTFQCQSATDFDITFCPAGDSSTNDLPCNAS